MRKTSAERSLPFCKRREECLLRKYLEYKYICLLLHRANAIVGALDRCSTSTNMDTEGKGAGELPDETVEAKRARDMCKKVLTDNGLLPAVRSSHAHPSDAMPSCDGISFASCKKCGTLDNPMRMLICDHCDKEFHVRHYKGKLKENPDEWWFCGRCTRVRTGEEFQAKFHQEDNDHLGETLEINPALSTRLIGWDCMPAANVNSISNWIQCYEKSTSNGDTICGKWRRAPLYVFQTKHWDCSCALPWDPLHADCSVPQEVETSEVLMQLGYLESLRDAKEADT